MNNLFSHSNDFPPNSGLDDVQNIFFKRAIIKLTKELKEDANKCQNEDHEKTKNWMK